MKTYLFCAIGLSLLTGSVALGQAPAPPIQPGSVPPDVLVTVPDGAACAHPKTICVPEHYTQETTKVVYSCGSEPLCVGYFHGLFRCKDCESGHCEHPYTRRYLIKKSKPCQEEATRCVPVEGTSCDKR
jgi:hypothetical protein